jgi:hypothetical protein
MDQARGKPSERREGAQGYTDRFEDFERTKACRVRWINSPVRCIAIMKEARYGADLAKLKRKRADELNRSVAAGAFGFVLRSENYNSG